MCSASILNRKAQNLIQYFPTLQSEQQKLTQMQSSTLSIHMPQQTLYSGVLSKMTIKNINSIINTFTLSIFPALDRIDKRLDFQFTTPGFQLSIEFVPILGPHQFCKSELKNINAKTIMIVQQPTEY